MRNKSLTNVVGCFLLFAGVGVIVAGCGKKGPVLAPVSGKVTLDGNPLPHVIVTFSPNGGGVASSGVTNEQGVYLLACQLGQGAVVGKHRVSIQSQNLAASAESVAPDEDAPNYRPDPYASARAPAFVEKIPARYNTDSQLVYEVHRGNNVIDLELKSQP